MRKFTGFNIDYSKLDQNTANAFKQLIAQSQDVVRDIDNSLTTIKGGLHSELNNLDYDSSGHTGFAESIQIAIFRDEKATSTVGGTFTNNAWRTRDLNTTQYNNITGCSLGSNQITLPAGTYRVYAICPAYNVNGHKAILYNITDSSIAITGTAEYTVGYAGNASKVSGVITITETKVFELQHRCIATLADYGFGAATGIATVVEVYASIEIEKIG